MRALVLSLLLIVLITIGLVMGRKVKETFENMPAQPSFPNPTEAIAIPVVLTMTPQVDTIQRGLQEQAPDMPGGEQKPACPKCPDMSKYIRMDEIPCWNCTLP